MEREIAQWVQPNKDRSDDPSHHERMQSCVDAELYKHRMNITMITRSAHSERVGIQKEGRSVA